MTIYLNPDSLIQPIQPEGQYSGKTSDQSPPSEEITDSEGEAFPHSEGASYATQEEVISAIEKAYRSNKNFQIKLVKYTQRKIKEIIGGKDNKRLTPEDIVEEAVTRILDMKRKWYKDKVEKIEHLVLMVIVSLIRIEACKIPDIDNQLYDPREAGEPENIKSHKSTKRKIIPLYYSKEENAGNDNTVADTEHYRSMGKSEIEDSFNFENIDEEELIINLIKEFENEEDIYQYFVFEEMLQGNKSNIDIANKLGIEVKQVENTKKKIKRKVFNLLR